MGHPLVQTPNLDQLAESSVVFDNAFCQSPVCMASRASVLTGRYPCAVRVRGMGILPSSETTFPEVLQRTGFRTAAFGKGHLTPELYTLQQLKSDRPTLDLRRFAEDGLLGPMSELEKTGKRDACIDDAKQLLANAASRVTACITDSNNMMWAEPKNRTVADKVQVEVLEALMPLRNL